MTRRRTEAEVPGWAIVAIVGGAAAALAAAAGAVVTAMVSRAVVMPSLAEDDTAILRYDEEAGTVALSVTNDSILPGVYSLRFSGDSGHARVGEVQSIGDGRVVRPVLGVDYGDLTTARSGRISGWYYTHPRELGVPVEEVEVITPVGPAPAWFVPAPDGVGRKWVIQTHGRGVHRGETIRAIPVFREHGYSSLHISYRNDGEAPPSADGRYALGDTEWQDLDAAIAYAVEHGAEDIVLMGWSMGGAISLQAMGRAEHRDRIRGIVLDSPAIDWQEILRFHGRARHVPELVGDAAFATLSHRWGRPATGQSEPLDLDRLDFVRHAEDVALPLLVMHSDDDDYVPVSASRRLAEARPDVVTYVPFQIAGHTKLWNYDRDRWNTAIDVWLTAQGL